MEESSLVLDYKTHLSSLALNSQTRLPRGQRLGLMAGHACWPLLFSSVASYQHSNDHEYTIALTSFMEWRLYYVLHYNERQMNAEVKAPHKYNLFLLLGLQHFLINLGGYIPEKTSEGKIKFSQKVQNGGTPPSPSQINKILSKNVRKEVGGKIQFKGHRKKTFQKVFATKTINSHDI